MVPQGSKIQSIISVAGHQLIRNLSEPSEFTLMHLDTYTDYLRQVEPRTESRAVRALLTTGGPRMKKLHGRYLEVYGPYQVMLNVDGISIYTRTYVTTDDDQIGQIYLGEDELKVRKIGHDAMMEQDAVHIGYENLIIKKLRIARETGDLEAETGEEPKKPGIGRVVESYFNLPNEYSSNIILTDSDFILTNRTCAIAITADMSFRTALAADFKREYKNVEFLWKQRPGIGGVAALPPAVSQIPGKYLCFLVTRATEKQHVDPENLVLSLTRLMDFLVEMDVKELSLPVYDPNRGRLHPRELYALVHVIFSDLHKKYYLSIG